MLILKQPNIRIYLLPPMKFIIALFFFFILAASLGLGTPVPENDGMVLRRYVLEIAKMTLNDRCV